MPEGKCVSLDMSIMNDKLVDWIGEECKVRELAKQFYPMVHKQGSFSVFVLTILQYVGNTMRKKSCRSGAGAEAGIRTQQSGETQEPDRLYGGKKKICGSHPRI